MENRKKQQLKKALKPIIQECIEEVLAEGTLIRTIIQEATKAASQQQVIVERHYSGGFVSQPGFYPQIQQPQSAAQYHHQQPVSHPQQTQDEVTEEQKTALERRAAELRAERLQGAEEKRNRLAEVAGLNPNAFSNIAPLNEGGDPERHSQNEARAKAGPLRNIDPSDPGVNISGIMDLIGGAGTWKNQLK